jgi:hypothetical protein
MRMLNMPSWGAKFLSSKGGRIFQFPNVFPSYSPRCSQYQLNFIPYDLPKVHLKRGADVFIFCHLGSKDVILLLVSAQHSKKIGDWLINVAPSPKKNKNKIK